MADRLPKPTTWVALSDPQVFGLSSPSDSDLDFGSGTAEGVDHSAVLASVMSGRFSAGNVGILWDRAITGHLPIYGSNVTIKGLHPGCGLRRPQAWQGPVVHNARPILGLNGSNPVAPAIGATGAVTLGGFLQSNLSVEGLTIHGGQAAGVADPNNGNSTGPKNGILFWGVDGASVRDCRVYDCGQYMVFAANVRKSRYFDNVLMCSNISNSSGQDGIHLGMSDDAIISGNRIASGDDSVSITPNDGDPSALPFPFARPGPVTDVLVTGNTLVGSGGGFRVVSSDQIADNITYRDNRGTCRTYLFLIDTYTSGTSPAGNNPRPGAGNIGRLTIDGLDILSQADVFGLGDIYINAAFDSIDIRGYKVRTTPGITSPRVEILSGTAYSSFRCDLQYTDTDGANTARVLIRDDGAGLVANVRGRVSRPGLSPQAIPIYRRTAGSLKALVVEADAESINDVVDYAGGTIESISIRGIHRNAGSGKGSVAIASGLTLTNLAAHGLATALIKSGPGTVTHQYPAAETYSFA